MTLNAHSPVPLYRQLADRIRADIEVGNYAIAEKIPSEHELAEANAIGRPTVRQATDLLVRQGILERRRGSGTYVLPPPRTIDLFSLAGTSAALQKSELDAKLKLVRGPVRERHNAKQASPGNEFLEQSTSDLLRIERQASVAGEPVLYETLWFDAELFSGLEKRSLDNQSLSSLVRTEFFMEPTSAEQTFFVVDADDALASRLNVAIGTALLRVRRVLHFGEYRNALHAEIVCRTDCFEFSQTLYPAQTDLNEMADQHGSHLESKQQ